MANEVRLIDANALSIRVMDASYWDNQDEDVIWNLVQDAPTVDAVEVVHGRWLDNVDENGYLCNAWRKCSACGGLNFSKRPPYCPNCGAKMDGGNEDDL